MDCDFSDVHVERLPFADAGSLFGRCSFHRARIGDFGRARMEQCDFSEAHLKGWFSFRADVVECRFAGRLEGVVFAATDAYGERRNEFRGNDFRDAELVDFAFRHGIDLDAQLLPDGRDYGPASRAREADSPCSPGGEALGPPWRT